MTGGDQRNQIRTTIQDHILTIEMNRPEKKNALTMRMYAAMTEAIVQAEGNREVRVMLITGAEGNFTSGNDLADFVEAPPTDEGSPVFRFMRAISMAEKPVLAAVSGLAVGIGTTMLLHCDLVYAGESAKFLMPFTNLGLCPEAGSSFLLPLLAGHQRAAELLLLGEPFGAAKGKEIGLVNEICPDSELLALALGRARRLAAQPQASVRLTKGMLKKGNREIVQRIISDEAQLLMQRLVSPEGKEAFRAFFEKRKPNFEPFQ